MKHIKRLSEKDYEDIFKLSQFAFQYTLTEEQLKRKSEDAKRHNIWGYEIDGELAGKLHIIPLKIYLNEEIFEMGGISSVATWPEYRRQGIANKLLIHALKEMKRAGQVISLLHPFHVGFYRKYGWELTFMNKKYTIPIERMKQNWNGEGYIRRMNSIEVLDSIYHQFAKKYNGMIVRDRNWWEHRVLTDDEAQIAVSYNLNGQAEGYIVYKVRDHILKVQEIAYTTQNAKYLLYEFIGNHDSMAHYVKMTVPEHDNLVFQISDPFFKQELEPYFMTRIVDVLNFLKQYQFREVSEPICLSVKDEIVSENNGQFLLQIESNDVSVSKITSYEGHEISCDVQQLVQMLLGFKRPTELLKENMINGELQAINLFEKMIPENQTLFTDFY